VFQFIFGIVALFYINPLLASVVLALLPLYMVALVAFNGPLQRASEALRESRSGYMDILTEFLKSLRLVKSFPTLNYSDAIFRREMVALKRAHVSSVTTNKLANETADFISFLGPLLVILLGGYLIINGSVSLFGVPSDGSIEMFGITFGSEMTVGKLFAFTALLGYVFGPINTFVDMSYMLQEFVPSAQKLFETLDYAQERHESNASVKITHGHISLQKVSLAIEGHSILHEVSFDIVPRSFVAIVGPSGSGKSMALELLQGYRMPTSGTFCVDGSSIEDISLLEMRSKLSPVNQETIILNGSILYNLQLSNTAITEQMIRNVGKFCGVDEFVKGLPQGYDTAIRYDTRLLSGGQLQRLSIMRALVQKKQVLIFDEPTSALDPENKKFVQDLLRSLRGLKTVILVTHDIEEMKMADTVVYMEQ
jgi:ABC-type bacteriocin/lantibiotic exporter with double-glycine peptidase domain